MPPIIAGPIKLVNSDDNLNYDFPQEFLDAFHATRGLCPASPEGDYGFMSYLYALCERYMNPPTPATLESISPNTAAAGGPDITLQLTGTGFVEGSTVYFGHSFTVMKLVSDTEGSAEFAAAGYALPGNIPVTVQIPFGPASDPIDFVAT